MARYANDENVVRPYADLQTNQNAILMKKILTVITALTIYGCEKNGCSTCTESYETKYRDVATQTTRYETNERKYSLCEQSDIDEVNGKVVVGDKIPTGHLQYYRITVTTTCE